MDEDRQEGLPSWDQVRLLVSLSPLIGFGQRFIAENDAHKRALIAADLLEWIASQTAMPADDKVAACLDAALKTPEGEALVRELVALGESFIAARNQEVKS